LLNCAKLNKSASQRYLVLFPAKTMGSKDKAVFLCLFTSQYNNYVLVFRKRRHYLAMMEQLFATLALLLVAAVACAALAAAQGPPVAQQMSAAEVEKMKRAIAWRDDNRCNIL
jgi:hypothetical protein